MPANIREETMMRSSIHHRRRQALLAATTAFAGACLLLSAGAALADDPLVTADRIGREDAPKNFVFRIDAILSNNHPLPQFAEAMSKLYEAYAKSHPDWRVDIQLSSTNLNQESASQLVKAHANQAPECALVNNTDMKLTIQQHLLAPVTQYFTKAEIDDTFAFVKPVITGPDGQIYGWWWTTDLRVIYRNTDLVPNPPNTWAELKAAALAAEKKAGPGVDGLLFNGGRNETTMVDFLGHVRGAGGDIIDANGKPEFAVEPNRRAMIEAMNFYKDLIASGASPRRVVSLKSYDDQTAAAVAGTAAMIQSVDSRYTQMKAGMTAEQFAKWQPSELPGPTPDHRWTTTGGGIFAAFSHDPEKAKACMDLIHMVYMGQANAVLGRIPIQRSLFDTVPMFNTPFYHAMRDFLVHGKPAPSAPIYPVVSNEIQVALGEVLTGAMTPEQAIDAAAANVEKAYVKQQQQSGN